MGSSSWAWLKTKNFYVRVKSELAVSKNCMKLLSRQIEMLQRNTLDSSQYLRREMIEINLVPEDIQDMQLEESICQVSFLLIALDDLSNNYNLIATMWEFI